MILPSRPRRTPENSAGEPFPPKVSSRQRHLVDMPPLRRCGSADKKMHARRAAVEEDGEHAEPMPPEIGVICDGLGQVGGEMIDRHQTAVVLPKMETLLVVDQSGLGIRGEQNSCSDTVTVWTGIGNGDPADAVISMSWPEGLPEPGAEGTVGIEEHRQMGRVLGAGDHRA